jgi:hypothetical protein
MRTKKVIAFCFISLVIVLLGSLYAVKADNGYLLASHVIAGGGGSLQAGIYSLSGTTGQAETGPLWQGGIYTLQGGFWQPEGGNGYKFFLPRVTK